MVSSVGDHAARARDPRAPPVSMKANVSVVPSCSFYGLADAQTGCRFPRSCRDCLATPGCAIDGSSGQCVEASTAAPLDDYHTALRANQTEYYRDAAWTFVAENATYCAASDPVCDGCTRGFQAKKAQAIARGQQVGTQFCVGQGGCVCVGMCEAPERIKYVYDRGCGQSLPHVVVQNRSLPRVSSTKRDPRAPHANRFERPPQFDECRFDGPVDVQGCKPTRSCRSCLSRPDCVQRGDYCMDLSVYNADRDFRVRNGVTSVGGVEFPSLNTSLCPATSCSECERTTATWRSGAQLAGLSNWITCTDVQTGCICPQLCDYIDLVRNKDSLDQGCRRPQSSERPEWALPPPLTSRFEKQPPIEECALSAVDANGCKVPRSVSSCLRRPNCVLRGHDCYEMRSYMPEYDFRGTSKTDSFSLEFPSVNTSLCSTEFNWTSCVNRTAGCICADFCDYVDDVRIRTAPKCDADSTDSDQTVTVPAIIGVLLVLIFSVLWFKDSPSRRRPRLQDRRRPPLMRHMLDQLPAVPRLDLFGWRAVQQQLLLKEEELLRGAESVSPVFRPVAFDVVSPSAPDFDPEVVSAPTVSDIRARASAPAFGD